MLTFKLKSGKGETALEKVITISYDCDLSVPADSLTITCPYDANIRKNADTICAYNEDRLVFAGQIDSVVTVKRAKGVILKLRARSPAGKLLDNEAEPVTYLNPTASLIENRHLRPFGIKLSEKDYVPYYGMLKIDKGMSHWRVLQRFCRYRYNSEPRVSGDGRAYLKGSPAAGKVNFSDTGEGIGYTSLKENRRRHALISEIRLKFQQTNTYSSVIKNTNPEAESLTRVRYVNAAADKTTLQTADKMFENSNRDSYALELTCKGCLTGVLGCGASVNDSVLGEIGGLAVRKVSFSADSRGESSVILLEKENFDVADELHN